MIGRSPGKKKWGISRYVITANDKQTPPTRAAVLFEMRCAFFQRSSGSVYPGFFETPQIGVGPHGPHDNNKTELWQKRYLTPRSVKEPTQLDWSLGKLLE